MPKLDSIDKQLLTLLQQNSKMNVKELENQLNLTKTPIYERIKRYEREGIIEKYVAVLNTSKLDNLMVVFCSVTLDSQNLEVIETFREDVANIPEVVECYLMGGANDFLLKVIVKNLEDYHQFSSGRLASLPNVSKIRSTFVLNKVKNSTVIPIS
ncbi:MAG: Lrp/AsnC family transcriptional regulator [Saprospiraceae bacterium]|nr:Lrp/AsnC family transcriptional regulator [Saprospiraceae bacterium]